MKKIYIAPNTEFELMATAEMLANSPGAKDEGYDPDSENLGREISGQSQWNDDDWDDEF